VSVCESPSIGRYVKGRCACDGCKEFQARKSALRRERERRAAGAEWECLICGAMLRTEGARMQHETLVHSGQRDRVSWLEQPMGRRLEEAATRPKTEGLPREHGTERGYKQHIARGERTCPPCREAHTEAHREWATRTSGGGAP
jgi:hypothetical protein